MKKSNKIMMLSLIVGISAIATIVLLIPTQNNVNNLSVEEGKAENVPYGLYSESLKSSMKRVPPIPISQIYGEKQVSFEDAKVKSGIDSLRSATYLPKGIELKQVSLKIDDNSQYRLVSEIFAPTKISITDDMTFAEVLDNHGIIIIRETNPPEFDFAQWVSDYQAVHGGEKITVKGKTALAFNGDPMKGGLSEVIFYDDVDNVQITVISSAYSKQILQGIAETL